MGDMMIGHLFVSISQQSQIQIGAWVGLYQLVQMQVFGGGEYNNLAARNLKIMSSLTTGPQIVLVSACILLCNSRTPIGCILIS